MTNCLIALGSNMGDRRRVIQEAVDKLTDHPGIGVIAVSGLSQTKPIGGPPRQDEFLNGAALIETALSVDQLLSALHQIERDCGRVRGELWAARQIDLDLLLYGTAVVDRPEAQIPHPRMVTRRFVLAPAAEIAADMIHPGTGWTIRQLLRHLDSPLQYFAVTGLAASKNTLVAREAAGKLSGRFVADPVEAVKKEKKLLELSPDDLLEFNQLRLQAITDAVDSTRQAVVGGFWLPDLSVTCGFRPVSPPSQSSIVPKILFHLDSTTDWFVEYEHDQAGGVQRNQSRMLVSLQHKRIRAAIAGYRCSPTVPLTASDTKRAVHELCAAVDAMK